jgi:glycine/D-amino acid oxidase-like deaminating enzyme
MTDALDVDVLIIGGGIMGLWLAKELDDKGYRFALLERKELGGEQTCHSHVYIHQGHIYNKHQIALAARLKSVTGTWQAWLRKRSHLMLSKASYFGFRNEADFEAKRAIWADPLLCLDFKEVPTSSWPEALEASANRPSAVKILVSTPEQCLDGNLLVKELQSDAVGNCTFRVDSVDQIRIDPDGVETVARGPDGRALRVRSSFLVFAAGAGNGPLLEEAFPETVSGGKKVQQIRKAHMLVIRGAKHDLPRLNGVFGSFNGLFIVSRELPDENVWLVSDKRSPAIKTAEDSTRYDRCWWASSAIAHLEELSPAVFEKAGRFRWGIYEAPKAEGFSLGEQPEGERIIRVNQRAWAVWPTKLTLAPRASDTLMAEMKFDGASARKNAPMNRIHWERPDVAKERWVDTSMTGWEQFRRSWGCAKGVVYGN